MSASSSTSGRLRKRLVGHWVHTAAEAPSNITMTIKSAPPRTARMMARMSIRHGYMNKRNEQAVWQRRFCALVPHTFLYYFESDDSESPRGVIDLELFTDISADDKDIVKLAPQDGAATRTFYFMPEADETADWLAALNRERYFQVREERDEYRDLQNEFSSQIKANVEAVSAAVEEKQQLQANLSNERKSSIAHLGRVKKLLLKLGVSVPEADLAVGGSDDTTNVERALQVIENVCEENENKWHQLLRQTEAKLEHAMAQEASQGQRYRDEMGALKKQYESEKQTLDAEIESKRSRRERVEAELASLRDHTQLIEAQCAQSQINLNVSTAQQKALEGKVAELAEHKRVLIKEFKSLRAGLDRSRQMNKKLVAAYQALDKKYQRVLAKKREGGEEEGGSSGPVEEEDDPACSSPGVLASLKEVLEEPQGADEGSSSNFLLDDAPSSTTSTPKVCRSSLSGPQEDGNSSSCGDHQPQQQTQGAIYYSPPRSGPSRGSSVLDLINSTASGISSSSPREPSLNLLLSEPTDGQPSASSSKGNPSSQVLRGFGAKLRGLLNEVDSIDTLLFPNPLPPPPTAPQQQQQSTNGALLRTSSDPKQSSASTTDDNRTNSGASSTSNGATSHAETQRCRRCGGTVEGPKLSTCRCLEPLMDDGAGGGGKTAPGIFLSSLLKGRRDNNSITSSSFLWGQSPPQPDSLSEQVNTSDPVQRAHQAPAETEE